MICKNLTRRCMWFSWVLASVPGEFSGLTCCNSSAFSSSSWATRSSRWDLDFKCSSHVLCKSLDVRASMFCFCVCEGNSGRRKSKVAGKDKSAGECSNLHRNRPKLSSTHPRPMAKVDVECKTHLRNHNQEQQLELVGRRNTLEATGWGYNFGG